MKNKIYTLLGLFLLSTLLYACSKDEATTGTVADHPSVAKLKKQEWVFTAETLNGSDVFTNKDACLKDDSYVFRADSICVRKENTIVCNPSNPGPFETDWVFDAPYSDLTFNKTNYTVLELSDTKIELQEKNGTGAVSLLTLEPKK